MLSSNTSAANGAANYIEDVFSTWLYKGNGGAQTITNNIDLSTKGGLVWIKNRDSAVDNALVDTTRGAGQYLISNSTAANTSTASEFTGFTTSGFGLDSLVSSVFNGNNQNYASWTFRKQPKFFDVVTYTGNGTAGRTVAHSLGSVPGCVIVKQTSSAGNNWKVYHRSLGGTKFLNLSATTAAGTDITYWNNTDPTSTVFTVGDDSSVNANGSSYVAYIFAHDAGGFGLTGTDNVISCGSYTGTGAAGNAITLGYEPQFIMVKATSTTSNWVMIDTMRGAPVTTNAETQQLFANLTNAEGSAGLFFPTATGFQSIGASSNTSGASYIYIAIRRGPMKVPTDGTKVFSPKISSAVVNTTITTGFTIDSQFSAIRSGDVKNINVNDRLRGVGTKPNTSVNNVLVTSSTGAETTGIQANGWSNTGFQIPAYTDSISAIYLNFQRAPSFFDEVCYTGTGATSAAFTHNLGAVPEMMLVKSRSNTSHWMVYTASQGNTKELQLERTNAAATNTNTWGSTTPTSTQFTVGCISGIPDSESTNDSGYTYVAYLFATCAGVSKVGSYTGTGTTKQVDCGFAAGARFVLIKRTDSTGDWYVWDTARGIVSGNDPYFLLNSTAAETTTTDYIDPYSAGFELSSTAPAALNASGGTYIFLAIA